MRILLIDADSKRGFPNLALMKISAYEKAQGNKVDLVCDIPDTRPLIQYDKVYVSCIFSQNKKRLCSYLRQISDYDYTIGGPGWDLEQTLPESIEHSMPDYTLYDVDFSMGFTSRGCIRKCGFCIVPRKEGYIRDHAPIQEFHHPSHSKVILLDNNFLASPRWKENLSYIHEHGLKVNFNQGLDIRLVTEEVAQLLAETKYYNWTFKKRALHFAFDDLRYLWEVLDGIDMLVDAGIPAYHLMFYVLVGYNTTTEEDLFRVKLLVQKGVKPYIMPYNKGNYKITRWVNRRYYQFIPYETFLS